MQEPVVGATSSNPLRVLSTLLLLLFTSIGAAQAEFIFAPSTPGGLPQSCHRRTARARANVRPSIVPLRTNAAFDNINTTTRMVFLCRKQ
jgi:hypothetical protein